MVLVVALASCKKTPEVNLKYVDVERDLVTVGATTANIQCDYQYIATLKKAFLFYGEGQDEVNMISAEMRVVQNTLYVELTGLKANTTYNYYCEFHNGFNSMRTIDKNFKTGIASGQEGLPTVVTAIVSEITSSSAKSGGEVTNNGGAVIIERGICWSINENPTLSDSHKSAGSGVGNYTAVMSGLEANTTYHIRAYATNTIGTAYGLDKEFTTTEMIIPSGAISGLFSVSPTQKVYFSQGNLQYQASTNTWRFAENQWDYVGGNESGTDKGNVYENGVKCDNSLISSSYNGWIDLFGWGTSGWNNSNTYYHPWDSEDDAQYYGPYGAFNLTGLYANSDWGYNIISNGSNQNNLWRTLTHEEWTYVFYTRSTLSGIRYAKACVNDVNGVILIPDEWDTGTYTFNNTNQGDDHYSNIISDSQWSILQNAGAVFMPAAGLREGTSVFYLNFHGYYYSASYDDAISPGNSCLSGAWSMGVFEDGLSPHGHCSRSYGNSVRLVQNANL